MDEAIKGIVVPFLREKGFKGSFPHFRRTYGKQLNLLTFQFSLYAPEFVVEIANCPATGFQTYWEKPLKPAECRVSYMSKRLRIGSVKHNTDYWYNFDGIGLLSNTFKKRGNEVLQNWEEAEEWWEHNPYSEELNSSQ